MKIFLASMCVLFFTSAQLQAQSTTPSNTDFLWSTTTASIYAETSKDVRHIIRPRKSFLKRKRYTIIDQGLLDGVEYSYYNSDDKLLVIGVPKRFPNNYYVTSICAFAAQNGGTSAEIIRSRQEECKCW